MIARTSSLLIALTTMAAVAEPEATKIYGDPEAAQSLLVRGTTDIDLFDTLVEGFVASMADTGVFYEQWGSKDLYETAAADCKAGVTDADILISSAVDLQVKLVNDGCARRHGSPLTEALSSALNWRDELFGVTREPAVLVYNRTLVAAEDAPRSRFDLIDLLRPDNSRYAGRIATYDIDQSGLGYLFAFQDSLQATTFGSLIEAFDRAGAVATCCSAEIIDGVVSGQYLIAYNVLGSYALARAAEVPELVVVAPEDYTLVLSRAAMIPRGTDSPLLAGRFVDYMLSAQGRADMAATRLITDFAASDPDSFFYPLDNQSAFRQIPLTPVLLVGLDRHKRALFLERWRKSFTQQ